MYSMRRSSASSPPGYLGPRLAPRLPLSVTDAPSSCCWKPLLLGPCFRPAPRRVYWRPGSSDPISFLEYIKGNGLVTLLFQLVHVGPLSSIPGGNGTPSSMFPSVRVLRPVPVWCPRSWIVPLA